MSYKTARGYLSDVEREYLFEIAKESNIIINVGVEYGASIHCFREGNPDAQIIAIDIISNDKFEGDVGESYIISDLYQRVKSSRDFAIIKNTERPFVLFVEGNSNSLDIDVEADVIFIDGCHWGECFQNDVVKYSKLATKYLLFHDYSDAPPHRGVKTVLDNWQPTNFEKIDQVDTIAVYKRIQQ
jgi:hypothetical protein